MAVTKSGFTTNGLTGPGTVDIGGVVPVLSAIHGSAFQPPAAGVISNGWMVCQGTLAQRTVSGGPANGAIIPDLSDNRFLQGSTVSWSNANDANPTYKSQPATYPATVSLTFTGTSVAYSTWFAPGSFTPAGTTGTAPISVAKDHPHPFGPHSHGVGALGLAAHFAPNGAYYNASPAPYTGTIDGGVAGTLSPVSSPRPQKVGLLGTSGTHAGGTVATQTFTAYNGSHSHTFVGTAEPIANWAQTGSYAPAGTVSGFTDRRPIYISCIYMIRVQ